MDKRKVIAFTLLMVLGISAGIGLYAYLAIVRPNLRFADEEWMASASEKELRDTCHKVLSRRSRNHHDAFVILCTVGNRESVIVLINALKWHEPSGKNGVTICTTTHCLEALRRLTGHDAGSTYNEWHKWWVETGCQLPAEEFYPRKSEKPQEAQDVEGEK